MPSTCSLREGSHDRRGYGRSRRSPSTSCVSEGSSSRRVFSTRGMCSIPALAPLPSRSWQRGELVDELLYFWMCLARLVLKTLHRVVLAPSVAGQPGHAGAGHQRVVLQGRSSERVVQL